MSESELDRLALVRLNDEAMVAWDRDIAPMLDAGPYNNWSVSETDYKASPASGSIFGFINIDDDRILTLSLDPDLIYPVAQYIAEEGRWRVWLPSNPGVRREFSSSQTKWTLKIP